jgi:hypothetical protein
MFDREARFILLSVILLLLTSGIATQAAANGRSFDECRQLAVSRGLARPSMDSGQRYERLKAARLKTKPQGFIARCMAGIQD